MIGIPLNAAATVIVGFCVKALRSDIHRRMKLLVHIICGLVFSIEVALCITLIIVEKNIFFSIIFIWVLSILVELVTTPVIRAIICGDTKIAKRSDQDALHYFWYGPPEDYEPLNDPQ